MQITKFNVLVDGISSENVTERDNNKEVHRIFHAGLFPSVYMVNTYAL